MKFLYIFNEDELKYENDGKEKGLCTRKFHLESFLIIGTCVKYLFLVIFIQ